MEQLDVCILCKQPKFHIGLAEINSCPVPLCVGCVSKLNALESLDALRLRYKVLNRLRVGRKARLNARAEWMYAYRMHQLKIAKAEARRAEKAKLLMFSQLRDLGFNPDLERKPLDTCGD